MIHSEKYGDRCICSHLWIFKGTGVKYRVEEVLEIGGGREQEQCVRYEI